MYCRSKKSVISGKITAQPMRPGFGGNASCAVKLSCFEALLSKVVADIVRFYGLLFNYFPGNLDSLNSSNIWSELSFLYYKGLLLTFFDVYVCVITRDSLYTYG